MSCRSKGGVPEVVVTSVLRQRSCGGVWRLERFVRSRRCVWQPMGLRRQDLRRIFVPYCFEAVASLRAGGKKNRRAAQNALTTTE